MYYFLNLITQYLFYVIIKENRLNFYRQLILKEKHCGSLISKTSLLISRNLIYCRVKEKEREGERESEKKNSE